MPIASSFTDPRDLPRLMSNTAGLNATFAQGYYDGGWGVFQHPMNVGLDMVIGGGGIIGVKVLSDGGVNPALHLFGSGGVRFQLRRSQIQKLFCDPRSKVKPLSCVPLVSLCFACKPNHSEYPRRRAGFTPPMVVTSRRTKPIPS